MQRYFSNQLWRNVLLAASLPGSRTYGFLRRVAADMDRARGKLIETNLRLVVSIARRKVGRAMLFLDLARRGNLGLIRAVDKFD